MRKFLVASFILCGLAVAGASAQPCGPLAFSFAPNGAGCAPLGGTIPLLSGALGPSPTPGTCAVVFTVAPGPVPVPLPVLNASVLSIGVSDPILDLGGSGFPGCVLRSSLDVILPMTAAGATFTLTVPVPADPAFAGATVYTQAGVAVLSLLGTLNVRISNGLAVSL